MEVEKSSVAIPIVDEMEVAKLGNVTSRRLGATTLMWKDRLLTAAKRDYLWEMRHQCLRIDSCWCAAERWLLITERDN